MSRNERIRRMHDHGLTYDDIAEIEGISKQRVFRILNPPGTHPPALLSTSAAAQYLGIHAGTLRRWTDQGIVKCIRFPNGRRDRRFAKQDLDKFLEQAEHATKGGDVMKR
jgi:excisionase family DNA binding protein